MAQETFTPAQFLASCHNRGLANRNIVKEYLKRFPKAIYTEDDMIECYRLHERRYDVRRGWTKTPNMSKYNGSDAENVQNSRKDRRGDTAEYRLEFGKSTRLEVVKPDGKEHTP
jgi:hypothetical protein